MKITPIAHSNIAQTNLNADEGRSAGAERVARAKAAAMGQPAPDVALPQTPEQKLQTMRKLRMKTQTTPPEIFAQPQAGLEPVPSVPVAAPVGDNPDQSEPAPVVSEEIKPLSPQFAALAKQKRALAVREAQIQAREDAQKQTSQSTLDAKALIERIKADPLGTMLEHGATYDQLTQQVLASMEGGGPALTKVESDLRKEIKSLKEAFETQTKTQTDSQIAAEEAALSQMQRQADALIAADDTYQMIRETGSNKDVRVLIKRVFDETGETMDVKEALEEIENDLLQESLKIARIKKVQAGLTPPPEQAPPPQASNGPPRLQMRTLTNRDTVSAIPTRRERAIAAAMRKTPA